MNFIRAMLLFVCTILFQNALSQDFIFVFLNTKADKEQLPEEEVKKIMDGHMANIDRLAKEGKLWAAGPFEGGGGIFVFKSGSTDEVKGWLETDPGVKAKRWNVEIFPYQPRHGSICSVGEEYEMTNYAFVRYTVHQTKDTMNDLPEVLASHNAYIKTWIAKGDVVAEGSLGEQEGSILILKADPGKDNLVNDPAIKRGSLTMSARKLFIARGSFCEPKK